MPGRYQSAVPAREKVERSADEIDAAFCSLRKRVLSIEWVDMAGNARVRVSGRGSFRPKISTILYKIVWEKQN